MSDSEVPTPKADTKILDFAQVKENDQALNKSLLQVFGILAEIRAITLRDAANMTPIQVRALRTAAQMFQADVIRPTKIFSSGPESFIHQFNLKKQEPTRTTEVLLMAQLDTRNRRFLVMNLSPEETENNTTITDRSISIIALKKEKPADDWNTDVGNLIKNRTTYAETKPSSQSLIVSTQAELPNALVVETEHFIAVGEPFKDSSGVELQLFICNSKNTTSTKIITPTQFKS